MKIDIFLENELISDFYYNQIWIFIETNFNSIIHENFSCIEITYNKFIYKERVEGIIKPVNNYTFEFTHKQDYYQIKFVNFFKFNYLLRELKIKYLLEDNNLITYKHINKQIKYETNKIYQMVDFIRDNIEKDYISLYYEKYNDEIYLEIIEVFKNNYKLYNYLTFYDFYFNQIVEYCNKRIKFFEKYPLTIIDKSSEHRLLVAHGKKILKYLNRNNWCNVTNEIYMYEHEITFNLN
jgi:hypothetical protein